MQVKPGETLHSSGRAGLLKINPDSNKCGCHCLRERPGAPLRLVGVDKGHLWGHAGDACNRWPGALTARNEGEGPGRAQCAERSCSMAQTARRPRALSRRRDTGVDPTSGIPLGPVSWGIAPSVVIWSAVVLHGGGCPWTFLHDPLPISFCDSTTLCLSPELL